MSRMRPLNVRAKEYYLRHKRTAESQEIAEERKEFKAIEDDTS